MTAKELGIFVILPSYMGETTFQKEMLLFADSSILDFDVSLFEDLRASLSGHGEYDLQNEVDLNPHQMENYQMFRFDVGNTKMTRKSLERILKEFYVYNI